jgi:hypothetical protein
MGDIQHATRKGDNMRHDETRDNTTAIEATIIEADNRDMTPVDMDNPREGVFDAIVTREDDEPEDDGQPSEYTEWQDYMGGDEYYDHSENACW